MRTFTVVQHHESPFLNWFKEGLLNIFQAKDYRLSDADSVVDVVFNIVNPKKPRPFRRKAQATFVISILESEDDREEHVIKKAYPYLVRTLSNHFIYIRHGKEKTKICFLTPEQGHYQLTYDSGKDDRLFEQVFQRLEPLASSQLVIDNQFNSDLPESLWGGDRVTEQLYTSGKKLDDMNLLPAPFPLEEFVSERDLRHIKKLYGIGGLSYGNLSGRRDEKTFWMSASGVNKANLKEIGQDILLIKDFDDRKNAMQISVPPQVTPKRASVDAIEHWKIYAEHPEVGAIVHVHAWMDGIKATEVNYPCGTIQLAETVADLVRKSDNPAQTVIGLKNHGLTITGRDLDDIFDRIEGRIIPQVPMS